MRRLANRRCVIAVFCSEYRQIFPAGNADIPDGLQIPHTLPICTFPARRFSWQSSLLLGNCTDRRQDFETADSRPLCEVMRDKWMAHADFDAVREREEFREIEERLSRIFSAV